MLDGILSNFLTEYQMNFWHRILLPAYGATFKMLFFTTIFSIILGFLLAVLLVVTNRGGIWQNKPVYEILSFIINIIRSFPVIILIVFMLPVTKAIVGTAIGVKAAIVPLTVSAAAFIAKLVESALQEVDPELVEAMRSFGLRDRQVVFRVMFSEAMPAIVSGVIIATIAILSATAVAGAVGAGGIGSVALTSGYQSFNDTVMYITVISLIIMVQLIQWIGNAVYRKMKQ